MKIQTTVLKNSLQNPSEVQTLNFQLQKLEKFQLVLKTGSGGYSANWFITSDKVKTTPRSAHICMIVPHS